MLLVGNFKKYNFMPKKESSNKIKDFLEQHIYTTIFGLVISTVTITYLVVTFFDEVKYKNELDSYKNTLSSIERRLGGNETIDVSKLVSITMNNQLNENSKFFPEDNFFASTNNYWKYKYTNPIELIFIQNGVPAPKEVIDNPMDMPIHIWSGGDEYKITHLCDCPFDSTFQMNPNGLNLINGKDENNEEGQAIVYSLNQKVFKPFIILQKWIKNNNSEKVRSTKNVDSIYYSINFDKIPKSELLGRFLYMEIGKYFDGLSAEFVNKEILSVQKINDIIYSQFLTTYNNIEINDKKQDKFYVYSEYIIINTANNVYTLSIQTPSLEPKKNSNSFRKITEWIAEFGIIDN